MKMKYEHFEVLRKKLKLKADATERERWDALLKAGLLPWVCTELYPYLNDRHIDAALRQLSSLQAAEARSKAARRSLEDALFGPDDAALRHERNTTGVDRRHWTETKVPGDSEDLMN
jgi:hypothetical protein